MPLNSRGDSKPSGDESTERFRHVGILAFGAFAIVVMTLSSQSMSSLRAALPPLSLAMNWLAMLPVPVDLDHVAFFALLGFSARLLAPRAAGWRILVLLFALALLTEFLQFWSEGRTPKLQDARDDMVGAMLGFALAGSIIATGQDLDVDCSTYEHRAGWCAHPPVRLGDHERAHVYQYMLLGPLFVPLYFLCGGVSVRNPFERAADRYAMHGHGWWPWARLRS